MDNWKNENNQIIIDKKAASGCIFIGLTVLGSILTIVGIIIILSTYNAEEKFIFIFGIFMTIISMVIFYAGVKSPAKGFSEKIIFDQNKKNVSIILSSSNEVPPVYT